MVIIALDHDKNIHTKDIGQDYLCSVLGLTKDGFLEEVNLIRSDEKYRQRNYENIIDDYSQGTELGMMLAKCGIHKDDITMNTDGNGFKKGVPEFLRHSLDSGDDIYVVSAGPELWLREFYRKSGFNDIKILGTELYEDDVGRLYKVGKGCGQRHKAERLKEYIHPLDDFLIASGDSPGDSELLKYAVETDGLAISTNKGALPYSHIGIIDGERWDGHAVMSHLYKNTRSGSDYRKAMADTKRYAETIGADLCGIDVVPGAYARNVDREAMDIFDTIKFSRCSCPSCGKYKV